MAWKPRSIRIAFGCKFNPVFGLLMLLLLYGWVNVAGAAASPPNPQSAPVAGAIPPTMFSMDLLSGALNGMPWPAVGFGGLRLWDANTSWTWLNPSRGVYNWSVLDQWLSLAQSKQMDVLYAFGVTPAWAAANPTLTCAYHPGACSQPADLGDWDAFVRALVTHSNGRIKYWELWNEPNLTEFWSGDVQTLASMSQRAYAIIKSIDPNAVVLTPAATAGPSNFAAWLKIYFAAGGGNSADVIAFHGYPPSPGAAPEFVQGVVNSIAGLMAGSGQVAKPIWDTEASWGTTTDLPDPDAQAAYVARSYMLQWSLGVQRFYWYAWNNSLWGSLWDPAANTILKPGIAYGETYKWLVGATLTSPCSAAADSTWTCLLSRPGGYDAEMIWNAATPASATEPFSVGQHFAQYRDLVGNVTAISGSTVPIGGKPILLEPLTAISLSRPFLLFGNVPVGAPAAAQTLVATNTGAVPLLISGIEATGDYSVLSGCGDSVPVGAACSVQVAFVPTAPGPRTGMLFLHDNAPGAPHAILLTNTNPPNPILSFPSSLDFSGQVIGVAPVSKNVTLTNAGNQSWAVGAPSVSNATANGFSISGSTCSVTLGPGAACAVAVTFSPGTMGVETAVLNLSGGGADNGVAGVPLSGMGWDFSLNVPNGSPASVAPNQSGSYNVNVTPKGGFMGTIALALSCNVSGIASCQVTPSSIAVTNASPITINIQTSTSPSARLSTLLGIVAVLLLGMAFRFRSLTALILAFLFLAGCTGVAGNSGSGQNASSGPPGIVVTAAAQGGERTLTLPVSPP